MTDPEHNFLDHSKIRTWITAESTATVRYLRWHRCRCRHALAFARLGWGWFRALNRLGLRALNRLRALDRLGLGRLWASVCVSSMCTKQKWMVSWWLLHDILSYLQQVQVEMGNERRVKDWLVKFIDYSQCPGIISLREFNLGCGDGEKE